MQLTIDQLRHICPNAPKSVDVFITYLNKTMERYNINTPSRAQMFIAQIAHESGQFRYTKELASGKAYEGRLDLGNNIAGDGVKYKGRGLIQITGKANYREVSKAIWGVDKMLLDNPQMLETPQYATWSAGWFWNNRQLNKFADLPDDWRSATKKYTPFEYVTYRINGGLNGIEDRNALYARAKEVIA